MVAVYNILPLEVRHVETVKDFQRNRQEMRMVGAVSGYNGWKHIFSGRRALDEDEAVKMYMLFDVAKICA